MTICSATALVWVTTLNASTTRAYLAPELSSTALLEGTDGTSGVTARGVDPVSAGLASLIESQSYDLGSTDNYRGHWNVTA